MPQRPTGPPRRRSAEHAELLPFRASPPAAPSGSSPAGGVRRVVHRTARTGKPHQTPLHPPHVVEAPPCRAEIVIWPPSQCWHPPRMRTFAGRSAPVVRRRSPSNRLRSEPTLRTLRPCCSSTYSVTHAAAASRSDPGPPSPTTPGREKLRRAADQLARLCLHSNFSEAAQLSVRSGPLRPPSQAIRSETVAAC